MTKAEGGERKFRHVMLRFPIGRSDELDAAAKELGLKPAVYALMQVLKSLNERKPTVTPSSQASTVNS